MDPDTNLSIFSPDWIDALLKELQDEEGDEAIQGILDLSYFRVKTIMALTLHNTIKDRLVLIEKQYLKKGKMEARWPTLLLQSSGRKLLWTLCDMLGVNAKGVPGSACRLLEKYLSRHTRNYLQESRGSEDWERYTDYLASRFQLLMMSCIQLAAKMSDLLAPLSATMIRATLMREDIDHTKAEIVEMEIHVYKTLDCRIPLWTTLEIAEFLATQVELGQPKMLEAVGLVINLSEYYRYDLEFHMRYWHSCACNTRRPSSSGIKLSLHNLQLCAGAVAAAARYIDPPVPDPTEKLATITRSNYFYIKAISDVIFNHALPKQLASPKQKEIPILKKRRLR